MLINEYLKDFDFKEYHQVKVKGTPEIVFPAMLNTNIRESLLINLLFFLRGMGNRRMDNRLVGIPDLQKLGFIKLVEIFNEELLFVRVTTSPTFSNCDSNIASGSLNQFHPREL